jgi:addiction module HigA family antidote
VFNPPHPGETLREDLLPALGLTVTEAAAQLGVTRAALSRVLNGRAAISPEMALRIERWLGKDRGGRACVWLAMQADYDLWQAEHSSAVRSRVAGIRRAREPAASKGAPKLARERIATERR